MSTPFSGHGMLFVLGDGDEWVELGVTVDGRTLQPGVDYEFDRVRGHVTMVSDAPFALFDEGTRRFPLPPVERKRKAQWKERFPKWGRR